MSLGTYSTIWRNHRVYV